MQFLIIVTHKNKLVQKWSRQAKRHFAETETKSHFSSMPPGFSVIDRIFLK